MSSSVPSVPGGTKVVIVFGSTGVQGVGFIESLAKYNPPSASPPTWRIVALTRSPSSNAAKRLASIPNVVVHKVAQNNQDDPEVVFKGLKDIGIVQGGVYGVFSVQGYVDSEAMKRQAVGIARASKDFGVKHLVWSSTDVGPLDEDWSKLKAFHFKTTLEPLLTAFFPSSHTYLRPVQFMNLLLPTQPFPFRVGRTVMLKYTYGRDTPRKTHQMISPLDIGRAGAKAFVRGPEWMGGVVRLAGDEKSPEEIMAIYKEVYGQPIALAPWLLAASVKRTIPLMRDFTYFWSTQGFRVDIPALRREIPDLEDIRTYLAREKALSEQK